MNIDKRFDIALGNVTTTRCGTLSKRLQHWTIFRLVSGISERLGTLSDKASGDKFIELMGCNHPWRVRLVASTQLAQSRRDGHELLSNLPPELVRDIRVKWLIEDTITPATGAAMPHPDRANAAAAFLRKAGAEYVEVGSRWPDWVVSAFVRRRHL